MRYHSLTVLCCLLLVSIAVQMQFMVLGSQGGATAQQQPAPSSDVSGDWTLRWNWSVTEVNFVGRATGAGTERTFSGTVDSGGNAIWHPAKGSGTATCTVTPKSDGNAHIQCTATLAQGKFEDGQWKSVTWQGEADGTIQSQSYGGKRKFVFRGRGTGSVDGGPKAGIDHLDLSGEEMDTGGSAGSSPTAKTQPNDIIATLQQIKGDVSVRPNGGSFKDASGNQQLRAGDDLATGPESEATITFPDGSTVYVRPFTQISVGALEKRRNSVLVRLNLEMGKIAAKVSKSETAAPDYSVKTPTATCSVRGTYFTVGYDQNIQTTTVLVEEGEVQVTPENSSLQSITLRPGQQARVTKNNVSPVTPVIARSGGVVGGSGTGNGELVPLKLYWNAARGDNFTTATTEGQQAAEAAGYTFVRIEGYVFRTQRSGTVPLKLYWSAEREDNFTTATSQGEREAQSAGYIYVRVEGYVYPTQQSGTAPLKNYWSAARGDNFTTATGPGEQDAKGGGYVFAWVEGYVLSKP
jgi:hypothetical protein